MKLDGKDAAGHCECVRMLNIGQHGAVGQDQVRERRKGCLNGRALKKEDT